MLRVLSAAKLCADYKLFEKFYVLPHPRAPNLTGHLTAPSSNCQALLAKRDREESAAERRVTSLQSQNVDLRERLNQALAQLKDALEECGAMAKKLEKLRKELEAETLRNVELRNRAMTLSEVLNFLKLPTRSPPSDLVMRNQQWPHGEQMSTALLSADGGEVASGENWQHQFTRPTESSFGVRGYTTGREDLFHEHGSTLSFLGAL
ncbi:lamin-L(I)-like [Ixodes scapularis]